MKIRAAVILVFSAVLAGCANVRNSVHVEHASVGKPYDLVVYVENVIKIGYNPEVPEDRVRQALAVVRRDCPRAHVVGQDTIITEIYGITSSKPNYVVLIRCMG